jgi:glycosyl transferase family 1
MSAGQKIRNLPVTHNPFASANGDLKFDALWSHGLERPHSERLRKPSIRLGIATALKLRGAIPPGQSVYAAIAEGDVFVTPHRTSDFGRAPRDAMAGGTPVLAFRLAASIDTVRDGQHGWLCSIDDPIGLHTAWSDSIATGNWRLPRQKILTKGLCAKRANFGLTSARNE